MCWSSKEFDSCLKESQWILGDLKSSPIDVQINLIDVQLLLMGIWADVQMGRWAYEQMGRWFHGQMGNGL